MIGNVSTPSVGSMNELLTLLTVLSDPTSTKTNIEALIAATKEYQDARDKAEKAMADAQSKLNEATAAAEKADALSAAADAKATALVDQQAQLLADRQAFETASAQTTRDLEQRKRDLDTYEDLQVANAKRELQMTQNTIDQKNAELSGVQERLESARAQAKAILGGEA